jgi:hypothetical protein
MPQIIDHPKAFSTPVTGVFVFMFAFFFLTPFEETLHREEASAVRSQGNKSVGGGRQLAEGLGMKNAAAPNRRI